MDIKTLLDAHQDIHNRITAQGGPEGPDSDQIRADLRGHLHRFIEDVGVNGVADLLHIIHEAVVQLYWGSTDHAKAGDFKYEVSSDELLDLTDAASAFVGEADQIFPQWLKKVWLPDLLKGSAMLNVSDAPLESETSAEPEQPELPFHHDGPWEPGEDGSEELTDDHLGDAGDGDDYNGDDGDDVRLLS